MRDVAEGRYFDPARMHVLDHRGEHLSVPELQRRGVYRREREGEGAAREPGAARPKNRFFG